MTARGGGVRPFEPPPAARESLQGHYAGFASRFAAFVVDLVVLTGIFVLVLAAINFMASVLTGKSIHVNRGDAWVIVAYAVWAFIYFAHFWGLNGKTAGGALFGLQVVTNDGGDVSGRRAIGRALAFPLSGIAGGILAIIPGRCSLCVWSPGLDDKGNSIAGIAALDAFTTLTGWSVF
jgi:uncharacterized RDD family membrane protein YckC